MDAYATIDRLCAKIEHLREALGELLDAADAACEERQVVDPHAMAFARRVLAGDIPGTETGNVDHPEPGTSAASHGQD
jgi:hypothetical protein